MAYTFKVASVTTKNNSTGNGNHQVITVQAYDTVEVPLEMSPLTPQERVQAFLAGMTTYPSVSIIALRGERRLFGGMLNSEGDKMKDGLLYGTLNQGDTIKGSIETFNCTPFSIPRADGSLSEPITSVSYFIFEGEDAIKVANRQLLSNNSCVVIDGKPTVDSITLAQRFGRNELSREQSQLRKEEHMKTLANLKSQLASISKENDADDELGG